MPCLAWLPSTRYAAYKSTFCLTQRHAPKRSALLVLTQLKRRALQLLWDMTSDFYKTVYAWLFIRLCATVVISVLQLHSSMRVIMMA